jgi:copper chaperone
MKSEELKIEGMGCHHCVISVQKELEKLDGLKVNKVRIGTAKVEYDDSKITKEEIARAIENAGYKLVS